MGIGSKIKEFRLRAGLTQKDLADKLHVTYQAVSRWENNDAEPSFDSLKQMCKVLNCTTNDLFVDESLPNEEDEVIQQNVEVEETLIEVPEEKNDQETKTVLAVCEECNKPIYDSNDINRVTDKNISSIKHVMCPDCYKKMQNNYEIEKKVKEESHKEKFKKRRIHSFIWPSLLAIFFIVVAISCFIEKDSTTGVSCLITALFAFTFSATMILKNTFLPEMWLDITSWGFVKMPGVIFELSFDGFIFLIIVKILFFILGLIISLLAGAFATVLALLLSVFIYPFALYKNLKYIE